MESPRGFNDPWLHLAAPLLKEVDLILLLGKKPDFVVRFAQAANHAAGCRVVQVDADAASLRGGAVQGIVADPAVMADQLAAAARGRAWSHRAWGEEVRRARATVPAGWAGARRCSPTSTAARSWSSTAASSASGSRRGLRRRRG
jgi:acetolactate synthase-1/2/3 large subunit